MKAVILAGGKGLRLRKIIKDLPKPMAPVAGRPFLEYLVLQLSGWGIKDIILSVGYKGDLIKSHFGGGEKLGVNISYSEEDKPLGTGGAIKKAAQLIKDESFIAMNGDSFLDLKFDDLIHFHEWKGAHTTIALASVHDTSRYGSVETDDKGVVLRLSEKGQGVQGRINGGTYLFNRKIIDAIPYDNTSLEQDVLPLLINNGLFGLAVNNYFIDIGIPRDYLILQRDPEMLFASLGISED